MSKYFSSSRALDGLMVLGNFFKYWVLALSLLVFTTNSPVLHAADLGGDVGERIGEIEITTNNNRRPTLLISNEILRWIQAGTPRELATIISALNNTSDDLEFLKTLHRLAPKSQNAHVNTALQSIASFGNSLLSCGLYAGGVAQEGQCSWARVSGNQLDHDTTGEAPGLDKTGFGLSAGAQWQLKDEWRLGIAGGYENTLSKQFDDLQALDKITGDVLSLGVVVNNRWGPVSGALSLSGSYGWYDSQRYVGLVGVGDIAQSDQSVGSISSRGRLSYLFGSNSFYLKPMIDLSATWLHLGSYSETGAGGANLHQNSASEWILSATPALEIGGEIMGANGLLWRPYVRAGILVFDKNNMQVQTSFIADPTGGSTTWDANFEKFYGEIEAGLSVLTQQDLNLKLSYEGRYGEHTRSHAGHLKFSVKF